MSHGDRYLEDDGPQAHRMQVGIDVERLLLVVVELHQVEAGQVARRVVQEHVFAARIGGPDPTFGRRGVPLIDGGVELHARVSARPGCLGHAFPELASSHLAHYLSVGA